MSVPLDHNPASMLKPSSLQRLALLIAVNCVRSTVIEDDHAAGKLDDPEMKAFNLEVANNRAIVEQQPADLRAVQAGAKSGRIIFAWPRRNAGRSANSEPDCRRPLQQTILGPQKLATALREPAPGASDIFDPSGIERPVCEG